MVKNSLTPISLVNNSKKPNDAILHIDFSSYPNWVNSIKEKNFTNHYENNKHLNRTLHNILSKLFPYLQSNITKVVSNRERHCHTISKDKIELVKKIIYKIHSFELDEETVLWQVGIANETRVIGAILSNENTYTFYPLFIDCNHLIYPSSVGRNNSKDHKKFKIKLN